MVKIEARKPQTHVKHEILDDYMGHWGGIILAGLKAKNKHNTLSTPHFIFVDCDSYFGRYSGELEDEGANRHSDKLVFGSPIIGVQALDKLSSFARDRHGINLRTNAILIEKDPSTCAELKKSLEMAGLSHRIRETRDFHTLQDNQIAVICADSTLMARQLITYTQKSLTTYSLYFIDPWGPSGVPLRRFVAPIIRAPKHDVILYMPYLDVHRKCGFIARNNLTEDQANRMHQIDEMFDDEVDKDWQKLAKNLDPDMPWAQGEFALDAVSSSSEAFDPKKVELARDREQALVRYYQAKLQATDPNLFVKYIRLPFPDQDRTMYYLYLTTHNETGALEMNKTLWKAEYVTQELRQRLKEVSKRPTGQPFLFELPPTNEPGPMQRPTIEQIADDIDERLITFKMAQRRELYKALANEPYFADEVNKALRLLRKERRISFDSELTHDTWIKSGIA